MIDYTKEFNKHVNAVLVQRPQAKGVYRIFRGDLVRGGEKRTCPPFQKGDTNSQEKRGSVEPDTRGRL